MHVKAAELKPLFSIELLVTVICAGPNDELHNEIPVLYIQHSISKQYPTSGTRDRGSHKPANERPVPIAALVAQLVERMTRNHEVCGSNPHGSNFFSPPT